MAAGAMTAEEAAAAAGGGAAIERQPGAASAAGSAGKLQLARIAAMPVQLDVRVPVPEFRVADLLALEPGSVVASAWPSSDDVPLLCGEVHMVWTEFEVVDQTLAVRVTRLG
jgi:flagellar motor switch protein FliN/FliY